MKHHGNMVSKVDPLLAFFSREKDAFDYNIRITYQLMLKTLDSYIALNGLQIDLVIMRELIKSNDNLKVINIDRARRTLKVRQWQYKKLTRNYITPTKVLNYKEKDSNKPYSFNYVSKYLIYTGTRHTLHANNWTAEQERRELLHYLHLQLSQLEEGTRQTACEEWQLMETLELVEDLELAINLINGTQ